MSRIDQPLAKLSCPSSLDVEHRGRLFALLEDCLARPVVWVDGPPGAGKTTLVASYLQAQHLRAIWYQVDAGDGDPAALFHYLGMAVQHLAPRRRRMPLLTAEYLADIAGFARRWFREFFLRLPADTLLVLDNYQEAAGAPRFHEMVELACGEMPPGLHIVVVSRDGPPAVFSRLQAIGRLARFDEVDLKFTLEEARAISAGRYRLDDELIRELFEASQGWAAGFTIMREIASRNGRVGPMRHERDMGTVFDYFATQIFELEPPASRDILSRIAFLPRMTAALAERVGGSSAAGPLLEHLHQRHLFTDRRVSGNEVSYQFHALFRAFLLAQAGLMHPPDTLRNIQRQTAAALEASARLEDALAIHLQTHDWASASRILMALSGGLSAQGRDRTLAAWIGQLPVAELEAHPELIYFLGVGQAYADPDLGLATLEHAVSRFATAPCKDMEIMVLVAIITVYVHAYARWERMDPWGDRLEALLADDTRTVSPAVRDRGLTRLLFVRAYRSPDRPALERLAGQALSILDSSRDVNVRLDAASQLLNAYCWIGDIALQEHIVSVVQPLLDDPAARPWLRISWYTHASRYWWVGRAEHSRAVQAVHRGLEIAEASGLSTLNGYLHGLLFNIRIDEGDLATAMALGQSIETMQLAGKRYVPAMVLPGLGLLALRQGDFVNARIHALAGIAAADEWGSTAQRAMALFLLIVVLIATGDHEEARARLQPYRAAQRRIEGRLDDYMLQLLEAYLALEQQDEQACDRWLGAALPTARKQGYVGHIYWYPPMMSRLYERALQSGIEAGFVAQVIRRRSLPPGPGQLEHWPWPLKIYTLGSFMIFREGRVVEFGRKTPTRLIMLLKAILAFGGRDVPPGRLIDAVWPHQEGDNAAEALQVALHRLRKLIGDHCLAIRDGRVSLVPSQVWVDTWAFGQWLDDASAALDACQPDASIALSRRALTLYRGDYLGGDLDAPWAVAAKEQWRSRFVAHVAALGKRLLAAGAVEEALAHYLRALAADDLAEEIYQGAMRCYRDMGRHAEGLALYRRLRATLATTLGVGPSPVTEALRHALSGT